MPCEVNSVLKLTRSQGYPASLALSATYRVEKDGYRIFPMDVPIALVDEAWFAHADVTIESLTWQHQKTQLSFRICRLYDRPFSMK